MKHYTSMTTLSVAAVLGAAVAATSFAVAPSSAQAAEVDGPKITWLVSLWGARRGFTEGVEGLAEYLSDKTGGNFELSIQYGGVLSDPKENIDGLQLGAFEAATVCSFYHPDKTPATTGLNLAFLPLPSFEAQAKVYGEYFKHPAVAAEWAKWNAVPLMSALMPNYEIMGRGKMPNTLEDWRGLRLNASGGHANLMEAIGSIPTTVPAPDLYTTMERGAVDGIVYPYTYAFTAYRVHEISDWVTDHWNLGTVECAVAANTDAYNALPDQYKTLLTEAVPAAYAYQIKKYAEIDAESEAQFAERGLKRIPITDEIRSALAAAVEPSWVAWVEQMNAQGLPGQELLDLILSEAAKAQ